MKLFFKISLALVLLLFIAVTGVALLFNPNDYKEDIITLVKEKTGRELAIPGDISLSLFPWIGIDLGAIELSNAKGFGTQPFAKMAHLQVRAKLWPLFKRQLEADTVVIEGLTLNLAKNKAGISNWDDLTTPETTAKPSARTAKETARPEEILAAFALNGIEIQDARLNWHDQQQNQRVSIKNVQLSMGKLTPATKIPFALQFHFQEKTLDAQLKFKSDILFSPDFKQFSFYDTQLTSALKLASLKSRLSPQLDSALIQLDLEKHTVSTEKLNLAEGVLQLQTRVNATQIFSNPRVTSHLTIDSFNPRTLAEHFQITLPHMSDKKALSLLNAQLDMKGTLDKMVLSNIKIAVDETHLSGNAVYKAMPASSVLNLTIDRINIDRYLPAPSATKEAPKSPSTKEIEVALIPLALLSIVNADADLKINQLQVKNTQWTHFHAVTHSKNGAVQIKPLSLQGYGATIKSELAIKALKNNALLSGNLNINNIKAGQLLNDLIGKDKLKGQASISSDFNTSGLKLSALKQNLNGNLKLNLTDAILKGFDLNHQRTVLEANLRQQPVPATPIPEETKIANLSATATIKKGLLTNNDLRAATPFSRVIGRGTVNIPNEQLNYTASVKFTESTTIKNNTPFEKMNSIPLDIHITGSFDKPEIKVDFQKAIQQLVKRELKVQERKLKEKANAQMNKEIEKKKKDVEKKLGDELKKLFKF